MRAPAGTIVFAALLLSNPTEAGIMTVRSTPAPRESFSKSATEVQVELYRVTDELVAHLKGTKKADLSALEARLKALSGK
ncbi:MAG: hypothetical protein HZB91_13405, partial [Elusimicrobia bacterium]|nr:hypothetical protein [Elusimicrobiota bacterium]